MSALGWYVVVASPCSTLLGWIIGRYTPSAAALRRHDEAVLAEIDKIVAERATRILNKGRRSGGAGG